MKVTAGSTYNNGKLAWEKIETLALSVSSTLPTDIFNYVNDAQARYESIMGLPSDEDKYDNLVAWISDIVLNREKISAFATYCSNIQLEDKDDQMIQATTLRHLFYKTLVRSLADVCLTNESYLPSVIGFVTGELPATEEGGSARDCNTTEDVTTFKSEFAMLGEHAAIALELAPPGSSDYSIILETRDRALNLADVADCRLLEASEDKKKTEATMSGDIMAKIMLQYAAVWEKSSKVRVAPTSAVTGAFQVLRKVSANMATGNLEHMIYVCAFREIKQSAGAICNPYLHQTIEELSGSLPASIKPMFASVKVWDELARTAVAIAEGKPPGVLQATETLRTAMSVVDPVRSLPDWTVHMKSVVAQWTSAYEDTARRMDTVVPEQFQATYGKVIVDSIDHWNCEDLRIRFISEKVFTTEYQNQTKACESFITSLPGMQRVISTLGNMLGSLSWLNASQISDIGKTRGANSWWS